MIFHRRPENDFAGFADTYFQRCRARVPKIEASAAKWSFEDLIPGLSDFDTRFFVQDAMTTADWCEMSTQVGHVHFELAVENKQWARNLEHLPGINLRWGELMDPRFYFADFSQWTFYKGDPQKISQARRCIADHPWSVTDEQYHWKKIAIYYGPYNRTVDPPVNLGAYENKYPLHSRLMHYMAPAVHSAVCLAERATKPGKLAAFRKARHLFPNRQTVDLVLSLVERHYEAPNYLAEPGLSELDDMLQRYLCGVVNALLPGSILDCPPDPSVTQFKNAVAAGTEAVSFSQLIENLKFARLMKGRLWFYAQDIPWFDSLFLIQNELSRMRANFFETPLRLFVKLEHDVETSAERALEMLEGSLFDRTDVQACLKFARLAAPRCRPEQLKRRALDIEEGFDEFLFATEKLLTYAAKRTLKE